ncbi:PorT family protein [Fulvivirga ulvae]|uniref:porin family protein n=1 Tax=Fulvivirga ulvae TaxID=2904245 RepID=UPI001F438D47|nr:porin family protein [Fulvivirga ulvae]UII30990.1 PorT family protein [Fulvivirga ulvae]
MKRTLFSVLAVIAFVTITNAQVKLGVKAGANLADLTSSEDDFEVENRLSFHFGGYLELLITDRFSIQPELIFSGQGAKAEYSETVEDFGFTYTYSYEDKVNLNYLNIPVLFKFSPTERFYIGGGPQAGVLLSAKNKFTYTFTGSGLSESESGEEDIIDELNQIDLSVAIGAGVELENGLNFSLRYNYGLTDIAEENDGDPVRNSVIQATAGFTFLK